MARFTFHPAPAYAPKPDPSYKNELKEIKRICKIIGIELMPWQKQILEVATEYKMGYSNKTGQMERQYKYHEVIVTVPRQSGKTTMVGPLLVHRALTRPNSASFFTAQTGQDAGESMRKIITLFTGADSKLSPFLKPSLRAGAEGLLIPGANSSVTRFSPTKAGLHGKTPHLVCVDEIWAFDGPSGDDLVQAINPAQSTIYKESQIWWISTAGDETSIFMNEMVDAARKGELKNVAYFEWSMPKGADPAAPETWWTFHPALGNVTEESTLEAEYSNLSKKGKLGEFLRAYCNIRLETANPLISEEDFAAMHDEHMVVPESFAVGFEVTGFSAAVFAAWRDEAGRPYTRILRQAPGTGWVDGFLRDLLKEMPVVNIAGDNSGATRAIMARIEQREKEDHSLTPRLSEHITPMNVQQYGDGCMRWLDHLRETKDLTHDNDSELKASIMGLVTKTINNSETIDRKESTMAGPAIASIAALWAWDYQRPAEGPGIFI